MHNLDLHGLRQVFTPNHVDLELYQHFKMYQYCWNYVQFAASSVYEALGYIGGVVIEVIVGLECHTQFMGARYVAVLNICLHLSVFSVKLILYLLCCDMH